VGTEVCAAEMNGALWSKCNTRVLSSMLFLAALSMKCVKLAIAFAYIRITLDQLVYDSGEEMEYVPSPCFACASRRNCLYCRISVPVQVW
jgi:hypothetical protein